MGVHLNPFTSQLDIVDSPSGDFSDLTLSAGTAAAPSISFTGDPNTGIYSPGTDQVALSTNGTGRLFVDANGNVGIKNASPSSYLGGATDLVIGTGSSAAGATIRSSTSSDGFIAFADGITGNEAYRGFIAYGHSTDSLRFATSGTERLRITSAGLVGIGTSSPGAKLEIRNDVQATTSLDPTAIKLHNNLDGGSGIEFVNAVAGKSKISFGVEGTGTGTDDTYLGFSTCANAGALTERARIDSAGNVGIGTTSPATKLDVAGDVTVGRAATSGYQHLYFADERENISARFARISKNFDSPFDLKVYATTSASSAPICFNTKLTNEAARIDSSGRLLVGTSTGTAPLTVAGTNIEVRNTNGAYISNSETTSVSTSATTIIGDAGFQGRLWVINGAEGSNRFCDLVMASTAAAPVVVQSYTSFGTPTARTYTRIGSAVQLAMASGTYDVRCIGFGA